MNKAPFVVLENITKKYGEIVALENVNLLINRGEVLGVLGPNGAGKTTLVSSISTFRKPTYGRVYVNGVDAFRNKEETRKLVGMVFQDKSLDELLTVKENLLLHASLFKIKNEEAQVNEVLNEFDLKDIKDRLVSDLSSGQKQLVEIAKSLLHKPQLIILDEPTVGLDPSVRRLIWDKISSIRSKREATIIITSHYLEEIERLCERIIIINKGRIVADDVVKKLSESGEKIVFSVSGSFSKKEVEDALGLVVGVEDNYFVVPTSKKVSLEFVVKKLLAKKIRVKSISLKSENLESLYFKIVRNFNE